MGLVLLLLLPLLLATTDAWASCDRLVKPISNVSNYTGTGADLNNGFSTLWRGRYIDTASGFVEGDGSHPGVDIFQDTAGSHLDINTSVMAICDGMVERVTINGLKDGGWGNSLTIRHELPTSGRMFSIYAHLDRFARVFSKGDPVRLGEQLGFVGKTGNSTGIHLHFQIDRDTGSRHPFFPNRLPPPCDPQCEVNTADSDGLVRSQTFSPLALVQQSEIAFASFTDPALFQAALTQQSTITFDDLGINTPIASGTTINGVTYTFTFNIVGFGGLVTNLYLAVSPPNTLGVRRFIIDSATSFFFPGDSVTLTFAQPIRAIGAYFSSNPAAGTAQGFIFISTSVGTAFSGDALPEGTFGFSANALRFVGLISSTPFSQATLAIINPSPGSVGFVVDNIIIGH